MARLFIFVELIFAVSLLLWRNGAQIIDEKFEGLDQLSGKCFDTAHIPQWWSYTWCYRKGIRQVHYNFQLKAVEAHNNIGDFVGKESQPFRHIYRTTAADCALENGEAHKRQAVVEIFCCEESVMVARRQLEKSAVSTFIERVEEPAPCNYVIRVCSDLACAPKRNATKQAPEIDNNLIDIHEQQGKTIGEERRAETPAATKRSWHSSWSRKSSPHKDDVSAQEAARHAKETAGKGKGRSGGVAPYSDFVSQQLREQQQERSLTVHRPRGSLPLTEDEQRDSLERVRAMFVHAYDSYMDYAYPEVSDRHRDVAVCVDVAVAVQIGR
jgi:hypothetical protein